ncbi:MAG TPA: sigma-70 family RNA polymerase sigma factor [Acidimicrobiales bacterium]|nr:sigma-70 family RNA polymerase sigma factor [Acidimicrobiales bacterium]
MARTQVRMDTGTDTALTERAAEGDAAAFEELYRRHADASYRVARAVTGNNDDAADAVSEAFTKVFTSLPRRSIDGAATQFRPYVLAATRNAGIDILRRRGRSLPSDPEKLDRADAARGPAGAALAGADSAMVIAALGRLPERWRTILWLTEVEGMAPRDAAPVMGLTANAASQLAVRARAALREEFLQEHLQGGVSAACEATVPLLGAYVAGGLAARDIAKVDQHLAACDSCKQRVAELEEVGDRLRRVIVPFPLAVAGAGAGLAASLGLVQGAAGGAAAAGQVAVTGGIFDKAGVVLRPLQKPLLYASVGLFSLGIMAVAIVGPSSNRPTISNRPAPVAGSPSPATLDQPQFALPISFGDEIPATAIAAGAEAVFPFATGAIAEPSPPGPPSPVPPPPPGPEAEPVANVETQVGPADTVSASVGIGEGSCTGLTLLGTTVGCAPAQQPEGNTATIKTDGELLGENEISL